MCVQGSWVVLWCWGKNRDQIVYSVIEEGLVTTIDPLGSRCASQTTFEGLSLLLSLSQSPLAAMGYGIQG